MKDNVKLYFICGTADCPRHNILSVVEDALKGGATIYQFREKGPHALKNEEKKALATQLQQLCARYNVPFIIDDDIDLAEALDADGLHIGQGDIAVATARERLPDKIIGLSVNNMTEYHGSDIELVDYIGVGPFKETQSKEDAKAAIGNTVTEAIRTINTSLPIVAIGGIDKTVVPSIIAAGANGVAVISAISRSDDPYEAALGLRTSVDQALLE